MRRARLLWASIGVVVLCVAVTTCGDEKEPEPAPCTATCTSSAQCPLALQYRCSTDSSCHQTTEACMAVCCPD